MNNLSQLAAVFAIAGGAGLLAYSRHIDPPLASAANTEVMMNSVPRDDRLTAANASGCGTALITLGSLTLAVPWIEHVVKQQQVAPSSNITS